MIAMYRLAARAPAPRDLLQARQIPPEDWAGYPPRRWEPPRLILVSRELLGPTSVFAVPDAPDAMSAPSDG
jgi:hypothetical protein